MLGQHLLPHISVGLLYVVITQAEGRKNYEALLQWKLFCCNDYLQEGEQNGSNKLLVSPINSRVLLLLTPAGAVRSVSYI